MVTLHNFSTRGTRFLISLVCSFVVGPLLTINTLYSYETFCICASEHLCNTTDGSIKTTLDIRLAPLTTYLANYFERLYRTTYKSQSYIEALLNNT